MLNCLRKLSRIITFGKQHYLKLFSKLHCRDLFGKLHCVKLCGDSYLGNGVRSKKYPSPCRAVPRCASSLVRALGRGVAGPVAGQAGSRGIFFYTQLYFSHICLVFFFFSSRCARGRRRAGIVPELDDAEQGKDWIDGGRGGNALNWL